MTASPVLALAWLALAHLVADFVIQSEEVATDKFGHGRRAWRALLVHVLGVAICLVPVVLVYGGPGLAFLVVVAAAHGIIDRTKVVWTRRVEARAMRRAHRVHEREPADVASSLGPAWTPIPGFLFVADQVAHAVVIGVAWGVFLASAPFTVEFLDAARRMPAAWDPSLVHQTVLASVIITDLLIVNVRAGLLFVATLVHPRSPAMSDEPAREGHDAGEPAPEERPIPDQMPAALRPQAPAYTLRIGPLVLDAEPRVVAPDRPTDAPASAPHAAARRRPVAPPAQVGAAVGVLERLIVVALVLTGASAAIGFVIAAKTLARFKQLDDRDFAEYYLLGTLASVAVALVSGLVGAAAIAAG